MFDSLAFFFQTHWEMLFIAACFAAAYAWCKVKEYRLRRCTNDLTTQMVYWIRPKESTDRFFRGRNLDTALLVRDYLPFGICYLTDIYSEKCRFRLSYYNQPCQDKVRILRCYSDISIAVERGTGRIIDLEFQAELPDADHLFRLWTSLRKLKRRRLLPLHPHNLLVFSLLREYVGQIAPQHRDLRPLLHRAPTNLSAC